MFRPVPRRKSEERVMPYESPMEFFRRARAGLRANVWPSADVYKHEGENHVTSWDSPASD